MKINEENQVNKILVDHNQNLYESLKNDNILQTIKLRDPFIFNLHSENLNLFNISDSIIMHLHINLENVNLNICDNIFKMLSKNEHLQILEINNFPFKIK